ncbi:MAG: Rid family hydrolase [Kiloniellaceae bacterium]
MDADNEGIASRSFRGRTGGAEHFIAVEAPGGLGLPEQIDRIEKRYARARNALGLTPDTAVFRRIFVSDVMNQVASVRESGLFGAPSDSPVAVSIVQQPPLLHSKVALLAYHVESDAPIAKRRLSPKHLLVEKNGLRHLWSTRLCAGAYGSSTSAAAQTRAVFDDLVGTLSSQGGSLRDHCVRTWIYLKDVDVFYQDMVDSRREVFLQYGLARDTHYIASTGIEGACAHRYDLVAMDAYSILGLAPAQISYLNAFDRLCETKDYDVTFERGTRIAYADRAHHFISGTASIDNAGRVMHPGDVLRQLDRALGNVDALLRSGSLSLDDMMHFTVYLRDPTDFGHVDGYLRERFPHLPILIVEGAVCRPEWLIEVEGVAIVANDEPNLPPF